MVTSRITIEILSRTNTTILCSESSSTDSSAGDCVITMSHITHIYLGSVADCILYVVCNLIELLLTERMVKLVRWLQEQTVLPG